MSLTTFLMCDNYRSLSKGRRHYINKMTWGKLFPPSQAHLSNRNTVPFPI